MTQEQIDKVNALLRECRDARVLMVQKMADLEWYIDQIIAEDKAREFGEDEE